MKNKLNLIFIDRYAAGYFQDQCCCHCLHDCATLNGLTLSI